MAQGKKKRRRNRHDPNRARIAAQREEAKRRHREERRREAAAQERRDRWIATAKRWGRRAALVLVITVVALWVFRPDPEIDGVEVPTSIRATSIEIGTDFDYGTDTPTSGPYLFGVEPTCGVFEQEISDEEAATAIYSGAVVVWYGPQLDEAGIAELVELVEGYDADVLLSPQDSLEDPIVATAWHRLMRYQDPAGVEEFIDIYRNRADGDEDCPAAS
jgi:hypothetical protein